MSSDIKPAKEVKVVGKLVPNRGRYLISITSDYTLDLSAIKTKRALITVQELV